MLTLDRTEFGSHYGSGKLFRFLGKHIVNDHIHLHVKIHAEREGARAAGVAVRGASGRGE